MEWLLVAVGVLLILGGLLDVFFTVLHYDGYGFFSRRLYKGCSMRCASSPFQHFSTLGLAASLFSTPP